MGQRRALIAMCAASLVLAVGCSSSSSKAGGTGTSSSAAPAATTTAAASSAASSAAAPAPASSAAAPATSAAAPASGPAVACGSGAVKKIGYSPNTLQTEFYVNYGNALKAAAAKCNITMIEADPGEDAAKQNSQIENMVNQGVQALAVRSQDANAMSAAVAAASGKKVPLVGLFGTFPGATGSVGPDDTQLGGAIGKVAGEALAKLKPGKASYNVVVLNNDSLGAAIITRRTSMEAAFKAVIPNYKIVANVEALTEDEGNKAMSTILQKTKDIDVVLSTNDSSSLGAISALKTAGLTAGKDLIVAISGSTQRDLQSIIDGSTPGGPYGDYDVWATATLNAMITLAGGGTLDATGSILPLSLVTSANAQQLYNTLYKK
jgi:ABC-type sugar transport system substrate-binding protein